MTRQRIAGLTFIGVGIVFLFVSSTNDRPAVWLALGAVFIALGVGRLVRSAPKR